MVSWEISWEAVLLLALLCAAALLVVALFLINRIHAHRAEVVRRLGHRLEQAVHAWARGEAADETDSLSRLSTRDRSALLHVCLRMLPDLDAAAVGRVRAALERRGILTREVAALRHRRAARRADACRVLGRLGHAEAVPALIERLMDSDPMVRQRAVAALGDLRAVEALGPIVAMLDDTSSWTDLLAIMALSRLGPESIPRVGVLLRSSKSPGMTKGLLQVTAQLGRAADAEVVRALARDADPEVRVEAVRALGLIPAETESVAVCLAALDDEAWPTRALAARSLGRLGDWRAIPRLERAMGDTAYWVRHHAGQALAQLGGAGRQALERRLTDSNPFVRDMATQMLYTTAASGSSQ